MDAEVIDATFIEPEVVAAGQVSAQSPRELTVAEQRLVSRISLVHLAGLGLGVVLGYRLVAGRR